MSNTELHPQQEIIALRCSKLFKALHRAAKSGEPTDEWRKELLRFMRQVVTGMNTLIKPKLWKPEGGSQHEAYDRLHVEPNIIGDRLSVEERRALDSDSGGFLVECQFEL